MVLRPAQTTIMIETIEPPDPIILGGATALVSGTGQIASLAVPPLFSLLSAQMGMAGAMRIFFMALMVAIILGCMIREAKPLIKN